MPNPITPEMRAALAEVVGDADDFGGAWHIIGETVENCLPQLRALLDALPVVKDSLIAEAAPDAADHSEDARAMVGEDARDAVRYRAVRELYWFQQALCERLGVASLTLAAIDATVDRHVEAMREDAKAAAASAAR